MAAPGPQIEKQVQRERVAGALNLNNSDVDLREFAGEVILYYSWGNQQGVEHLAQACTRAVWRRSCRAFSRKGHEGQRGVPPRW